MPHVTKKTKAIEEYLEEPLSSTCYSDVNSTKTGRSVKAESASSDEQPSANLLRSVASGSLTVFLLIYSTHFSLQ